MNSLKYIYASLWRYVNLLYHSYIVVSAFESGFEWGGGTNQKNYKNLVLQLRRMGGTCAFWAEFVHTPSQESQFYVKYMSKLEQICQIQSIF